MDIRNILQKLHETMPDSDIGSAIGAPQSTISRLRSGKHKTTSYERGVLIIKLAESKGISVEP